MGAGLRSWWKNASMTLKIVRVIGLIVVVGLIVSFIGGYFFNWTWTGFNGARVSYKTLYDWLQLLFIPVALAAFGFWLNQRERSAEQRHADKERKEAERHADYEQKAAERRAEVEREIEQKHAETERAISLDNQHEAALQGYINNMSALLLEMDLREPVELDKVRKIGRVRTLTVLPHGDGRRKAIVLQFLDESDLINKDNKVIDLKGADFSGVELCRAQLSKADLSSANLCKANLCSTILIGANLSSANLFRTDLRGVDLSEANLSGAIGISNEELEKEAKSLQGATMPDGTKHDQ